MMEHMHWHVNPDLGRDKGTEHTLVGSFRVGR